MKRHLISLVAALTLSASAAQAITIVNAGFEDPAGSGLLSFSPSVPLPGWTVISGDVETVDAGAFWAPSEGSRSLDLNGLNPGAIRQTLSGFQVGSTYELLFDMGGNFYSGAFSQIANASIGSASQDFTYTLEPGDTRGNFTWKEMSLQFTASATSQDLTFTQVSLALGAGAALDNVRVNLVGVPAIPVPATLPLLLAGVGAFAWMRRRKG
ncbi:DUF642 domain-containing protein [Tateyamaria armeniaca]|uniref:DUF642 domain-containing protein n=1 Tax=Tateyamaria armeniaca TaxID=2518930 RepID=A0ABW8UYA6_9RHOB